MERLEGLYLAAPWFTKFTHSLWVKLRISRDIYFMTEDRTYMSQISFLSLAHVTIFDRVIICV